MIYIAVISAKQIVTSQCIVEKSAPAITAACKIDSEAQSHFLRMAHQRWPVEDGWMHHSANPYALPTDSGYFYEPVDPMLPAPAALAAHEHQTTGAESRDAAGLPGGNPMPRPRIRSLVDADHDRAGCTIEDCPTCTILETRELLHPIEL